MVFYVESIVLSKFSRIYTPAAIKMLYLNYIFKDWKYHTEVYGYLKLSSFLSHNFFDFCPLKIYIDRKQSGHIWVTLSF